MTATSNHRARTGQARGTEPAERRRPVAATIGVARLFVAENRDTVMLFATTVFMVGFGLVMVLSASSIESHDENQGFLGVFWRQALYAAIGIPLMLVASRMPPRFWKRWAWPALVVGVVLLMLVVMFGYAYGGNRNWLSFGGFSAQPSEFVKLALILWVGWVLAKKQHLLTDWKHVALPIAPVALVAIGFVLLGNDLGTASIMIAIVLGCLFFAGVKLRFLAIAAVVLALVGLLFAQLSSSRMERLAAWRDGCTAADYADICWQVQHGTWALASGGLFGVGLGNSKSKWSWLPEADNDFIFAVIGEELGLIGAIVVLALFVVMAIAFARILRTATDPFARIVTGAVMVWVVGQALVNIAVVLGLLPVLGVPLPLISAGGSALIATLLAIGVVLSFARAQQSQGKIDG